MSRKRLSNKEKFSIIVEGLKGLSVSDICVRYGISQGYYYKIRDQFFSQGENVFQSQKVSASEQKLKTENIHLKRCVVDLTLELKKNEDW